MAAELYDDVIRVVSNSQMSFGSCCNESGKPNHKSIRETGVQGICASTFLVSCTPGVFDAGLHLIGIR